MSKPRLLDLFCGAGGASVGYARAGFEVVGVDIEPQPNYPFEFHQQDAMRTLHLADAFGRFDAIHASPPCQAYGSLDALNVARWERPSKHPRLIEPVRTLLRSTGLPYVIENTERAPLEKMVKLCGSMFGLRVRRHRFFESNYLLMGAPACQHRGHRSWDYVGVYGERPGTPPPAGDGYVRTARASSVEEAREAMAIDWMTWDEIREAIPPAYTEWVGGRLIAQLPSTKAESI